MNNEITQFDGNPILQTIAATCKSLQQFNLRYFSSIEETIQPFFHPKACPALHHISLSDVAGVNDILYALCRSNCPIDELAIIDCTTFRITSLWEVLDTFQLKSLQLALCDDNLLVGAASSKPILIQFMQYLLKIQTLKDFYLDLSETTILFEKADEKDLIDHWLFHFFPQLQYLTLKMALKVNLGVMHVWLSRILKHCMKLQQLDLVNSYKDIFSCRCDSTAIHFWCCNIASLIQSTSKFDFPCISALLLSSSNHHHFLTTFA